MNEKFNKNAKVEKFTTMLGIAVRLIVIDPFIFKKNTDKERPFCYFIPVYMLTVQKYICGLIVPIMVSFKI